MTLTTHALTGAIIGKYFQNPIAIIISAIALHYAIDTLRHGEYLDQRATWKNTTWKVLLDFSIGISLVFFLVFQFNQVQSLQNISLAVFFSLFPDFLTLLYWKLGIKKLKFLHTFHTNIHKHPQQSPERRFKLRNMINDIILSTISVIILALL